MTAAGRRAPPAAPRHRCRRSAHSCGRRALASPAAGAPTRRCRARAAARPGSASRRAASPASRSSPSGATSTVDGEALAGVTALNGSVAVIGQRARRRDGARRRPLLAPTADDRRRRPRARRRASSPRRRPPLGSRGRLSDGLARLADAARGAEPGAGARPRRSSSPPSWRSSPPGWRSTLLLFATAGRPIVRTSEEIRRRAVALLRGRARRPRDDRGLGALLLGVPADPARRCRCSSWSCSFALRPQALGDGRALPRPRRAARRRAARAGAGVMATARGGARPAGARPDQAGARWLGVWVWTAATLIGIGAALRSKFGRCEPWFDERRDALPALGCS